jgi:4-amino-4-deoxy-L-arabinose transferase
MPSTRRVWLLWLALLLAYFAVLGCRPLRMPDEVRYAEISREMLDSGDWVVPRLLRLPYFEKPVGGYWLINTSQLVFGHGNFAVAVPVRARERDHGAARRGTRPLGHRRPAQGLARGSRLPVELHGVRRRHRLCARPMLTMWLTAALGAFWLRVPDR